jgi:uncharacterized protein
MKPRFDGQPPLDAYGEGGFRLRGQRFEGSILVTPRGLYPWHAATIDEATPESLHALAEAAGSFDFFLVGCGAAIAPLPAPVAEFLRGEGVNPDLMDTGAACRTYNFLLAENRRVAAALIAIP